MPCTTSPTRHTQRKKQDDNNKEVSNKDDSDQKKESKFDENQEMAIDASIPQLDNLADENDKDSNDIEIEETSDITNWIGASVHQRTINLGAVGDTRFYRIKASE